MTDNDPGLEAAFEAIQNVYTAQGVVIDTSMLEPLLRTRGKTNLANRLDRDGWHIGFRRLLHNDQEWRTEWYVKVAGKDEPLGTYLDVTTKEWDRLRLMTSVLLDTRDGGDPAPPNKV